MPPTLHGLQSSWNTETRRIVDVNSQRLTTLETHREHLDADRKACFDAHTKAEGDCRGERREAEGKLEVRMTAVEKVVANLSGVVTRFVEGQKARDADSVADKDREVKVVDSKATHRTAIICAVISVIGALLVAYMSWTAKAVDADLPKVVAAAVAAGIKQAGVH